MDWTQKQTETLLRLWNEGLSASQIASEMGITSRNAVVGKIHRLRTKKGFDIPARELGTIPTGDKRKVRIRPLKILAELPWRFRRKPEPAIVAVEPAPAGHECDFWQLKAGMCKWPLQHVPINDSRWCGAPAVCMPWQKEPVYCRYHCDLAYQAGTAAGGKRRAA